MTIRVRPVDRGRSTRDPNRRTFYVNLAFAITVVVAILILVIVGATTWYGTHLAAAASVDGQTITKDQFLERAQVEAFRIKQLAARVNAEVAAGRLTAAQAQSRIDALNNQAEATTLIDTGLQKLGLDVYPAMSPPEFQKFLESEMTRWGSVIRNANIKPE